MHPIAGEYEKNRGEVDRFTFDVPPPTNIIRDSDIYINGTEKI